MSAGGALSLKLSRLPSASTLSIPNPNSSTVLVLLFVFGMLMVDAEGRRLSFNDNAPPAEMLYQADGKAFLKINAFELDARIPVTGAVKVWRFFEKFFCLPQSSNGEHG